LVAGVQNRGGEPKIGGEFTGGALLINILFGCARKNRVGESITFRLFSFFEKKNFHISQRVVRPVFSSFFSKKGPNLRFLCQKACKISEKIRFFSTFLPPRLR
jgi:hypothetical protein